MCRRRVLKELIVCYHWYSIDEHFTHRNHGSCRGPMRLDSSPTHRQSLPTLQSEASVSFIRFFEARALASLTRDGD